MSNYEEYLRPENREWVALESLARMVKGQQPVYLRHNNETLRVRLSAAGLRSPQRENHLCYLAVSEQGEFFAAVYDRENSALYLVAVGE